VDVESFADVSEVHAATMFTYSLTLKMEAACISKILAILLHIHTVYAPKSSVKING
jgi:hypothetical protein